MNRKMSAGNSDEMDVPNSDDHIKLNVGGCHYMTTRSTLTRYPKSKLGAMFSGRTPFATDADEAYFIDANGKIFDHILTFLRRGKLSLPEDFKDWDLLAAEADFYQIEELINALRERNSREGLVKLDVGGYLYETERSTLTKYPHSKLDDIVSGRLPSAINAGAYFIDANGQIFVYVLNFLRRDELLLPNDFKEWDLLVSAAEFYQIKELKNVVDKAKMKYTVTEWVTWGKDWLLPSLPVTYAVGKLVLKLLTKAGRGGFGKSQNEA